MRCPKCGSKEKCKSGFKKGKQRYLCKKCGCNYTKSEPHGYSLKEKREALRYYTEGIGFRRIEILLEMSHTAVIYWVKKAGGKLKNFSEKQKAQEQVDVLELDEMCTTVKKPNKKWIWLAVERISQEIKGFYVGYRGTSSFESLSENIQHISAKVYASDA